MKSTTIWFRTFLATTMGLEFDGTFRGDQLFVDPVMEVKNQALDILSMVHAETKKHGSPSKNGAR